MEGSFILEMEFHFPWGIKRDDATFCVSDIRLLRNLQNCQYKLSTTYDPLKSSVTHVYTKRLTRNHSRACSKITRHFFFFRKFNSKYFKTYYKKVKIKFIWWMLLVLAFKFFQTVGKVRYLFDLEKKNISNWLTNKKRPTTIHATCVALFLSHRSSSTLNIITIPPKKSYTYKKI